MRQDLHLTVHSPPSFICSFQVNDDSTTTNCRQVLPFFNLVSSYLQYGLWITSTAPQCRIIRLHSLHLTAEPTQTHEIICHERHNSRSHHITVMHMCHLSYHHTSGSNSLLSIIPVSRDTHIFPPLSNPNQPKVSNTSYSAQPLSPCEQSHKTSKISSHLSLQQRSTKRFKKSRLIK